jgi:hypothetical protein
MRRRVVRGAVKLDAWAVRSRRPPLLASQSCTTQAHDLWHRRWLDNRQIARRRQSRGAARPLRCSPRAPQRCPGARAPSLVPRHLLGAGTVLLPHHLPQPTKRCGTPIELLAARPLLLLANHNSRCKPATTSRGSRCKGATASRVVRRKPAAVAATPACTVSPRRQPAPCRRDASLRRVAATPACAVSPRRQPAVAVSPRRQPAPCRRDASLRRVAASRARTADSKLTIPSRAVLDEETKWRERGDRRRGTRREGEGGEAWRKGPRGEGTKEGAGRGGGSRVRAGVGAEPAVRGPSSRLHGARVVRWACGARPAADCRWRIARGLGPGA